MGTNLSHLSHCVTVLCTVPIKVHTCVRSITAGSQLINLSKIILIQQDSVFVWNSARFRALHKHLPLDFHVTHTHSVPWAVASQGREPCCQSRRCQFFTVSPGLGKLPNPLVPQVSLSIMLIVCHFELLSGLRCLEECLTDRGFLSFSCC